MGHFAHIATIVGVFVAANHIWPKGIMYGEREQWEKEHRRRKVKMQSEKNNQKSNPKSTLKKPKTKSRSSSSSSASSSSHKPERDDVDDDDNVTEYIYSRRERELRRRERERLDYYEAAREARRHRSLGDYEYEYGPREDVQRTYSRRSISRY